jgi:CheY-like chemotaxis protein
MVVAEVLVVTPDVQRAIARGADASELGELAARGGMHTLWESGIARVLAGTTSFHELIDSVVPPAPSEADAPAGQDGVDAILARLQPGAPPAAPAAATAAAPPAAPGDRGAPVLAHDAAGAPPRVLVVDEDRAARLELRAALELDGFAVIEACDGAAALQYAERLRPDVVVTELALPRLDGIGLLQALAALAEPPQAFVRTAQSDAALLAWACESGAVAAVGKEVDPRMVVARLQAALSRAA